ncbi:MAG: PHP domain-containing protein [Candidatus Lokiarchaeota archaeon]|nr:PHP domain-containing protein [Candidatus Lokiarchaeota archaeon]
MMTGTPEFPKINLHIHTIYSDGRNDIETMVHKAKELNFDYIAITDHFSNAWKADIIKTLDSYKKINLYLERIEAQNKVFIEEKVKLRVLKGIEIDLGSSKNYILKLIDPSKFDLILFEYLESPESIGFIENVIEQWINQTNSEKQLPIFGLAHFDPSTFIYGDIDILLTFLQKYDIYFEFNSAYSQFYASKYQELFFDIIKQHRIAVGMGADSHNISELKYVKEPFQMIIHYGLEQNLKMLINKLREISFY